MILSEKDPAADANRAASSKKAPSVISTSVWFVRTGDGEPKLAAVPRKLDYDRKIENVLKELLDGPRDEELKEGFGSEIPRGTVLLGVRHLDDRVEVDLSRRFATGGGISSIETRLEQLSHTLKDTEPRKDVYLNVEGRRLAVIGGEGIEVKQPINR